MTSRNIQLVLASQSPRRSQLLADSGFDFIVSPPDDSVERSVDPNCLPEDLVLESALAKARAIAPKFETALVLAADTVAQCDDQVLGKPVDRDHAERMLRLMSGRSHQVLTGICLWHRPSDHRLCRVDRTVLNMDPLSETQLESILDSNGWIGKAGGFGYQDGLDWLHIEAGLESNVVGLPVEHLDQWMEELLNSIDSDECNFQI